LIATRSYQRRHSCLYLRSSCSYLKTPSQYDAVCSHSPTLSSHSPVTVEMDFVPSLADDSSSNSSVGLLTPQSSPLFRPSHPKDAFPTHIAQILNDYQQEMLPTANRGDVMDLPRTPSPENPSINRICVIGAGYVGSCLKSLPVLEC